MSFYAAQLVSRGGPLQVLWVAATLDRQLKRSQVTEMSIPDLVDGYMAPDAPGGIFGAAAAAPAAQHGGRKHHHQHRKGAQPDGAPLALRLSGQLLLGVCRIYVKKVAYLAMDCEEALCRMRQIALEEEQSQQQEEEEEALDSRRQQQQRGPGPATVARRERRAAAAAATAAGHGAALRHLADEEDALLLPGGSSQQLPALGSQPSQQLQTYGSQGDVGTQLHSVLLPGAASLPLGSPTTPYGLLGRRSSSGAGISGGGGYEGDGLYGGGTNATGPVTDMGLDEVFEVPEHFEYDLDEMEALRAADWQDAQQQLHGAFATPQQAFSTPQAAAATAPSDVPGPSHQSHLQQQQPHAADAAGAAAGMEGDDDEMFATPDDDEQHMAMDVDLVDKDALLGPAGMDASDHQDAAPGQHDAPAGSLLGRLEVDAGAAAAGGELDGAEVTGPERAGDGLEEQAGEEGLGVQGAGGSAQGLFSEGSGGACGGDMGGGSSMATLPRQGQGAEAQQPAGLAKDDDGEFASPAGDAEVLVGPGGDGDGQDHAAAAMEQEGAAAAAGASSTPAAAARTRHAAAAAAREAAAAAAAITSAGSPAAGADAQAATPSSARKKARISIQLPDGPGFRSTGSSRPAVTLDMDENGKPVITAPTTEVRRWLQDRTPLISAERAGAQRAHAAAALRAAAKALAAQSASSPSGASMQQQLHLLVRPLASTKWRRPADASERAPVGGPSPLPLLFAGSLSTAAGDGASPSKPRGVRGDGSPGTPTRSHSTTQQRLLAGEQQLAGGALLLHCAALLPSSTLAPSLQQLFAFVTARPQPSADTGGAGAGPSAGAGPAAGDAGPGPSNGATRSASRREGKAPPAAAGDAAPAPSTGRMAPSIGAKAAAVDGGDEAVSPYADPDQDMDVEFHDAKQDLDLDLDGDSLGAGHMGGPDSLADSVQQPQHAADRSEQQPSSSRQAADQPGDDTAVGAAGDAAQPGDTAGAGAGAGDADQEDDADGEARSSGQPSVSASGRTSGSGSGDEEDGSSSSSSSSSSEEGEDAADGQQQDQEGGAGAQAKGTHRHHRHHHHHNDGFTARTKGVLHHLQGLAVAAATPLNGKGAGSKRRKLASPLQVDLANGPLLLTAASELLATVAAANTPGPASKRATPANGRTPASASKGAAGASRLAAAHIFYDLLVLCNRGYVELRQQRAAAGSAASTASAAAATPQAAAANGCDEYGDLVVLARPRLLEEAAVAVTPAGTSTPGAAHAKGGQRRAL